MNIYLVGNFIRRTGFCGPATDCPPVVVKARGSRVVSSWDSLILKRMVSKWRFAGVATVLSGFEGDWKPRFCAEAATASDRGWVIHDFRTISAGLSARGNDSL